jgi:pyruvate/2-oxoglutarate dehydrogenase complex dihydrolipoamide dehydrogenase (E3) component
MQTWDALVLGAGQAGVPLAVALARAGRKTALVERDQVGGTCINVGCTPTKTLVASARVAALASRASDYGITTGPPTANWPQVRDREQRVVQQFRSGGERRLREAGVTLLRGSASFVGSRRLTVREHNGRLEEHSAAQIFINVGGRPTRPQLSGLDSVPALDSSSILTVETFPEHLLILGGGYGSLEFGQIFRRLGSRVCIVEQAPRLLSREDPDVCGALRSLLEEEGVEVHLGARAERVERAGRGVRLHLADATVEGTTLLLAVGRSPNTEGLNCAAAGVELDGRGYIRVDDRLRTTADGVFATGDVTGAPAFTHVSYDDFRVLRGELLGGEKRSTVGRLIPYTLFTDPQLGRVGLTETEARARGLPIRVAKLPMSSVARAIESDETRGFLKAVVHAQTEQILGFAALGFEGGELASLVQVAMMGELPYPVLREAIFSHPGLAESLNNLFSSWA